MFSSPMKVFFPSFGCHLPNTNFDLQEQNVHPLSIDTSKGLDLDFSPLMAFEKIIIDRVARDRVLDVKRKYLNPMRESLSILEDEDLVETVDYGPLAKKVEPIVISKTNALLQDVDTWRRISTSQWNSYQPTLNSLRKQYEGHCDPEIEELHFGVYCYLKNNSSKINISEARKLNNFIASRRKLTNNHDRELFKSLITPLVQNTILNSLLREGLDCPFIDWDDLNEYYSHISEIQIKPESNDEKIAKKSQELFSIVLPDLQQGASSFKASQFAKFIKDRSAIRSLRHELNLSMRNGTKFDQKWATSLRDDAAKHLLRQKKRAKILKWILLPAKFIPIPFASAAAELVGETALKTLEVSADIIVDQTVDAAAERPDFKYKWYYTLMEVRE